MLHEDRVYTEIQEKLGVSSNTIKTWKDRYAKEGLDGLKRPRPGGRRVPPEIEAKVCAIVQGPPPEELSHWTAKTIAEIVMILNSSIKPRRSLDCI